MHPVASFVELDLNSLRVSSLSLFLDFWILLPRPLACGAHRIVVNIERGSRTSIWLSTTSENILEMVRMFSWQHLSSYAASLVEDCMM